MEKQTNLTNVFRRESESGTISKLLEKNRVQQEKREKVAEEEKRLYNLIIEYAKNLKPNTNIANLKVLQFYRENFTYFEKTLYYTGSINALNQIKDSNDLFQNLPRTNDREMKEAIYTCLLFLTKNNPYSSYHERIKTYKIKNGYTHVDIFDFPEQFFHLIDNNVYFKTNSAKSYICIFSKTIADIFSANRLKLISSNELKIIFKFMKKDILKSEFTVEKEENISILFKYYSDRYAIAYDTLNDSWQINNFNNKVIKPCFNNPIQIMYDSRIYEILSFLFNMDVDATQSFARFVSSCFNSQITHQKINLLQLNKEDSDVVFNFINFILSEVNFIKLSLGDFRGTANLTNLLLCQITATPYVIVIQDTNKSITEYDIETLKNYANGKKIFKNDSIVQKITYQNKAPIIFCSNNEYNIQKIKNLLPYRQLELKCSFDDEKSKEFLINISSDEISYLKHFLCLYGLKLISSNKRHTNIKKKTTKNSIDNDEVINQFFLQCCEIKKKDQGIFVYGDELYEYYVTFYKKLYRTSPLLKRQFIKTICLSGKYEYKRPHVSRSLPNKMAFIGISVNEDKLKNFILSNIEKDTNAEFKIFKEELESVNINGFFEELKKASKGHMKVHITKMQE